MPIDIRQYPDGWPQITYFLKEFHDWRCERCGVEHGSVQINADGEPYIAVLTCAHLNHDVENSEAELAVFCSACHLNYDRPMHLARIREALYRRKLLKQLAAGQLVLIEGMLPAWAILPTSSKGDRGVGANQEYCATLPGFRANILPSLPHK